MPGQPIIPETPLQRVILEQAQALARRLEQAAADAPAGQSLERRELATLGQGRQFLRDAPDAAVQRRIEQGEKKGRPPAPAPAAAGASTRGRTPATS